jgi:NHL repeat
VVVTESMLVAVNETTRERARDNFAPVVLRSSRMWGDSLLAFLLLAATLGCQPGSDGSSLGEFERIWGSRGISDGRFQKPRAMAIDAEDRIYVVDMTARIQVFGADGRFLRGWSTPDHEFGRPTGISIGIDGRVLVADTHYYQVLIYSPEGRLVQTIGNGKGDGPGEFGLVTDAVQDSKGNFYVAEYGEYDRIQKFSSSGEFLLQWGGHGSEPGQFLRPQNLAIDDDDQIWVADACNHRIQIFDSEGNLQRMWGREGSETGQLQYPYDLVLADDGSLLVSEFGRHRIQRWDRDGHSLGEWGSHGRGEGQLFNPWALVQDSTGRIHVLDTNNHRVQVVRPRPGATRRAWVGQAY